jgi:hypothetical protein
MKMFDTVSAAFREWRTATNSRGAPITEASLTLAEVRKRKIWYLLPVVAGFGLLVD